MGNIIVHVFITPADPIYCSPLTPPSNGSINSTDNSYSSVIFFGCNQYFEISMPLVLMCSENGWNSDIGEPWNQQIPSCKLTNCSDPGTPINGSRNSNSGNSPSFINRSVITFECENGYRLNGASEVECLEGQWSSENPSCALITCYIPAAPANGYFSHNEIPVNETITFVCNSGYTLSNTYPLLCLPNGTWNASIPECILTDTTVVTATIIANGTDSSNTGVVDESYRFLIVAVVVTIFVILFGIVCVLLVMLARKRSTAGYSAVHPNGDKDTCEL